MPSGPQPQSLQQKVAAFPYWYHKIQLPGGVVTPGWAPHDAGSYRVPADLTGKRVLDVGAWDGFWTFEALKRGASEVVAIDDFSDYLGRLESRDRPGWGTFDLCREALGFDQRRCQRHEMQVYDVTEQRLGRFDIVFFFGTLYHLRHPLLALIAWRPSATSRSTSSRRSSMISARIAADWDMGTTAVNWSWSSIRRTSTAKIPATGGSLRCTASAAWCKRPGSAGSRVGNLPRPPIALHSAGVLSGEPRKGSSRVVPPNGPKDVVQRISPWHSRPRLW